MVSYMRNKNGERSESKRSGLGSSGTLRLWTGSAIALYKTRSLGYLSLGLDISLVR